MGHPYNYTIIQTCIQLLACILRSYFRVEQLTFLAQICSKVDFWFEIKKSVEIRISIFKIPCMPTFRQNKKFWLFWPKFAQKGNKDLKFRKLILEEESASLWYHGYQFSDKTDNFDFLGPNLPKINFGVKISKI